MQEYLNKLLDINWHDKKILKNTAITQQGLIYMSNAFFRLPKETLREN